MATKVTFLLPNMEHRASAPADGQYQAEAPPQVESWGYMQPISSAKFASVVGDGSNVGWQFVGHTGRGIPLDTEAVWQWHDGREHRGTVASFVWKGGRAPATVTIGETA